LCHLLSCQLVPCLFDAQADFFNVINTPQLRGFVIGTRGHWYAVRHAEYNGTTTDDTPWEIWNSMERQRRIQGDITRYLQSCMRRFYAIMAVYRGEGPVYTPERLTAAAMRTAAQHQARAVPTGIPQREALQGVGERQMNAMIHHDIMADSFQAPAPEVTEDVEQVRAQLLALSNDGGGTAHTCNV